MIILSRPYYEKNDFVVYKMILIIYYDVKIKNCIRKALGVLFWLR
ncbi:hypothetical protein B4073_1336 [Bacillus subtilis]|nr:hypothetical protein B4068_1300 [Bacillus subtilis]KIN57333.1 hypothetical protein B4073_1336 [Bacillus subtilis]